MYEAIPFEEEHVRGMRLFGKIDKTTFVKAMREIMPDIETSGSVNLYIEMEPDEGISGNTLWESFKFAVSEGQETVKSVDKIAVVTGKTWLRTWTKIESSLLPGLTEKAFAPDEKKAAMDWVKVKK